MVNRSYIIASGLALTLLATGLVTGCSSSDSLADGEVDGGGEGQVAERYGVLSVEYLYPRGDDDDGLHIQAHFLDIRGVAAESALEALEVWKPRRRLAAGECLLTGGDQGRHAQADLGSLHLLDVGDIAIDAPRQEVMLRPRRLPDLLSSFYGVVYNSRWAVEGRTNRIGYYPGASYGFGAAGTSQAGGFAFALEAPEPMVLLAADGVEVRDRTTIVASAADPLELIWHGADGDRGGEVFIDLSAGFGPDQIRVQCRGADQGAFAVPADMLGHLHGLAGDLDLEMRRVHRHRITVDGLDEVDVYFATTDRVHLVLD